MTGMTGKIFLKNELLSMLLKNNLYDKSGSFEFWSDNNSPKLRSLTKYHTEKGEYEGLSNQSTDSHGDTIDAWNNGDILPIPLAIYTQSVSPKRLIRNLYTTLPSLFMPSAPP